MAGTREGRLEAPTRHALNWTNPEFYDEDKLFAELERVYDICHGCRRCVSLCQSFPALCDLCFLTKCPYVPPHEWDLDFPHLMLQAKAVKYKKEDASFRDRTLTSTDMLGRFAGFPIVAGVVNAMNNNSTFRGVLHNSFGVHKDAVLPRFDSKSLRSRIGPDSGEGAEAAGPAGGKVALFATCYGNNNDPQSGEDLAAVLRHNGIAVTLADRE